MALQVEVLEQSFKRVAPQGKALVKRFYERLFARYPAVRPLFRGLSMPAQRKKLLASLALVVSNLRRPDRLREALLGLGARHVGYGARPAHYEAVGENLLAVLGEFAGAAWTPNVKQAWAEAYAAVTSIMLEGAATAGSPIVGKGGTTMGRHRKTAATTKPAMSGLAQQCKQALDRANTNVLMCDPSFTITYANQTSLKTLRALEGEIRKVMPNFAADRIVGSSIDQYHKAPDRQRRILADPANLPHRADIQIGPVTLNLLVTAVESELGEPLGFLVEWEDVTAKRRLEIEMTRLKSSLDHSNTNVLMCDRSYTITYVNHAAQAKLKELEPEIRHVIAGFNADKLVGMCIDGLHKAPERQRRILDDPKNLPHRADIQLGPLTLELQVTAIVSEKGEYLGNTLEWADVTAKRKMEREMTRLKTSLDNARTNVMVCDRSYTIVYVNKASVATLQRLEHEVRKILPGFAVDKIIGSNIDQYHKNPAHQRQLLDNPKNLPYRAEIKLGPLTLDLNAAAIMSDAGEYLGNVVEWADVTAQKRAQLEVDRLISAAAGGQLSERMNAEEFDGFFQILAQRINSLLGAIVSPLDEAQRVLRALAEGDLRQQMSGSYQGDFDKIKSSLNEAIKNLTGTVTAVRAAVAAVTEGSEQISQGNHDLAQRTSEQAAALEETSAAMEEMTATVKQNADNAKQANQLAIAARDIAMKGGSVTTDAVAAMAEINKSSKKIGDIITVIDEIAFQTNLLALNAAVEAARAGEHGRGFAVVAAEVRNLAQRSATAAKEIKGLIQESIQRVTDGSGLVDKSGKTLEEIVESVKRVTDIIAEISAASQEQATGIDQVNKAIMQMDETTQQNAALVEEAAASSQSVKEQATGLQHQVEFFKLDTEVEQLPLRTLVRAHQDPPSPPLRKPAPAPARPACPRSRPSTDLEA